MPLPSIRTGADASPAAAESTTQDAAWRLLAWLAVVFVVVGLIDIIVAWTPLRIGTPEWEFGTVTGTLNNLPVPAMGLILLLASGAALERRGQVVAALGVAVLLLMVLLLMGILYGLTAPLAWKAGTEAVGRSAVGGSMLKSMAAFISYCSLCVISITFAATNLRRR
jgi:hypothetical protein